MYLASSRSSSCAVKSAGPLRVKVPRPENWFVPLGSNRSGGGGNKAVGASGVEGQPSLPPWLTNQNHITRRIQPRLAEITKFVDSVSYCSSNALRRLHSRGPPPPHQRHWQALAKLVGVSPNV
jgi:hypothetical protein